MRWEDVEAFVATAEQLSFTKASARLQVSKQIVSRRVSRLERSLGQPLFTRTTAHVELTPAGLRLLAWAQETTLAWEQLRWDLRPADPDPGAPVQPFVLGVCRLEPHKLLQGLTEAMPTRDISLRVLPTPEEGVQLVLAGEITALLWHDWPLAGTDVGDELVSVVLYRGATWIFMSSDHPSARDDIVELAEFKDAPWIGRVQEEYRAIAAGLCEAAGGFTPTFAHITDDFTLVETLLREGLGVDLGHPGFRPSEGIARRPVARAPGGSTMLAHRPLTLSPDETALMVKVCRRLYAETLAVANPEMLDLMIADPVMYPGFQQLRSSVRAGGVKA